MSLLPQSPTLWLDRKRKKTPSAHASSFGFFFFVSFAPEVVSRETGAKITYEKEEIQKTPTG
jgi:hypothetical protein